MLQSLARKYNIIYGGENELSCKLVSKYQKHSRADFRLCWRCVIIYLLGATTRDINHGKIDVALKQPFRLDVHDLPTFSEPNHNEAMKKDVMAVCARDAMWLLQVRYYFKIVQKSFYGFRRNEAVFCASAESAQQTTGILKLLKK